MLLLDFINIGYGDSILVRQQGTTGDTEFCMLVDCGDTSIGDGGINSKRISAADFLTHEGITHLDVLVLTHLHRDHIGGVIEVLKKVSVEKLWSPYMPPIALMSNEAQAQEDFSKTGKSTVITLNLLLQALRMAQDRGSTLCTVNRSQLFQFTPDLAAEVLCGAEHLYDRQQQALDSLLAGSPDRFDLDFSGQCTNLTGIRMHLTYHGRSILLAADVYASYWPENKEPCYLLKAPHHACTESMTNEVIAALQPEITVVCVSSDRKDNRPAPNTVLMLQEYSGTVLFTDAVSLPGVPVQHRSSITVKID